MSGSTSLSTPNFLYSDIYMLTLASFDATGFAGNSMPCEAALEIMFSERIRCCDRLLPNGFLP